METANMYSVRKLSKYKNVRQTYNGYSYMSKKEAQQAWELDMQQKVGEIKGYKRQFKLSLDVNGAHIANYYVDFLVERKDGSLLALEVKGFKTDLWVMKWKLAQALYKDKYDFEVVF